MSKIRLREAIASTVGGGTPPRSEPTCWNGDIRWASVKDFKDGDLCLRGTQESISETGMKKSASNLIPPGIPIICMRMAVGRVACADFPVAINQDLRALFPNEDFDSSYLLRSIDANRSKIEATAIGSTVKGISIDQLLSLEIVSVSKAEQAKVAELLATMDRAIEQAEALIAKQQRIKTGLMQDLLTRGIDEYGNLRSESTHEFKMSQVGRVPIEWDVDRLSNFFMGKPGFVQTGPFGSQLHAHEYVLEGIPVVMPQDIDPSGISEKSIARISQEKADSLPRHKMQAGDVVFARRGDLSRCAVVQSRQEGWLCGTGCLLMRPPLVQFMPFWIEVLYKTVQIQRQVQIEAVGSTMPNLNTGILFNLFYPKPPLDEQERIKERLEAMNSDIRKTSLVLDKLRRLKTGLMQDLLTGRKRVTALLKLEPTH